MSKKIKHIISILIEYFKTQELKSSEAEKNEIWENIASAISQQSKQKQKKIRMTYAWVSAAAVLMLIVLLPLYIYQGFDNHDYLADYAEKNLFVADSVDKQITLILSDEKERKVKNESSITYSKGGIVSVNKDTIINKKSAPQQKSEIIPNQIIIPKGKRSNLTLADGSKLWINAGTRVVYPPVFEKDKREIYVEGEVYLEVARDESRPFYVKTKGFEVEVLGTKFNVSAYTGEKSAEVVLVDGSVKVNTSDFKTAQLTPDHMIDITEGKLSKPVKVDVSQYVSWVNDMLIYKDEPLSRVLRKLDLYYGINIEYDSSLYKVLVSGKLDLKEDMEDVLHTISYTAPVRFEKNGDKYKVINIK